MKVSYQWLSEYVDLQGVTPEDLAEKLTRGGIEIDRIEYRNLGVKQVVVGYVLSAEKHPDADKLNVCKVDAGTGEELQIVCGAKNVAAGQKVAVALVGAELPGDLKIKRAKLRGVESQGMICSAKELGLNDKLLPKAIQEGILVLPVDSVIGTPIVDVLSLEDAVLELDLTPNRSDCLSMLGVAYEVAAILGQKVIEPQITVAEKGDGSADRRLTVRIDAKEACYRYAARLVNDVKQSEAPLWMQNRLMAAGIRPINNIVDITNYVMLEYGQPLHAFDYDEVQDGKVVVRLANEGETIVTLDDQERALTSEMLLITDGTKPVGIAGVMGGANSEVSPKTRTILIESAHFAGSSIRKTSKQLGLRSEASLRFEKEVNPDAVIPALNRAAQLMEQLAGGVTIPGIVDANERGEQPLQLPLRLQRVNDILGTSLSQTDISDVLDRLQFAYKAGGEGFEVSVPKRRGDIQKEIDLIEEVARLHGYDEIPTTFPVGVTTPGGLTRDQKLRRGLREAMVQSGFYETITYTFSHPSRIEELPGLYPESLPVSLALPMSEERGVLRTSLLPHLLEAAQYNVNRKNADVALFEIGSLFLSESEKLTDLPQEPVVLAGLWTGRRNLLHWSQEENKVDFYDLKGALEKALSSIGLRQTIAFRPSAPKGFHAGRTASIHLGDQMIGTIGQLHPEVQQNWDLKETFVFEMELEPVFQAITGDPVYKTLPRFPAVTRDIAVVVGRDYPAADLEEIIRTEAGEWLESVNLFDLYAGERLGSDRKSMAYALVFRHSERTLTDEEVHEIHQSIVQKLEAEAGAELRK